MTSYFRLISQWFLEEIWAIPGRMIALVFIIFIAYFPFISNNPYLLKVITLCNIFCIFAVSWDVLAGYTGQFSLGHALFFGVGNYTVALLSLHLDLSPWITIPLSGVAAILMGLIAGISALRLKGFYLALVTLCFPIILTGIVLVLGDFTGGDLGLSGWSSLTNSLVANYYINFLMMLVSVYVMYKLIDSGNKSLRVGIILQAIREDEISARTSGINTTGYKLLAFCISGFFAGIAGALYGLHIRVAGPSVLSLSFSFQVLLWTIFGGIGTIYGAVVGVFTLYPMMEFLQLHLFGEHLRFVVLALILIFTLLYMPEGITVWVRGRLEQECPRCRLKNMATRLHCRACRAPLRLKAEAPGAGMKGFES